MPKNRDRNPRTIGKAAGRKVGKAGKRAGKKAGKAAAGAAKKIGKKLLSFLKKIFLHKPAQYLKIAAKNLYIKITETGKKRIPEIVPEQKVPEKHRDNNTPRRKSGSSPKQLPAPELARQAQKDKRIKQEVLSNPELIDAQSREEAEIKLVLAGGGTPASGKVQQSPDKFFEQLGKEWAALWAYNQYGNDLRNKLIEELNGSGSGNGGTGRDPRVPGRSPRRRRVPPSGGFGPGNIPGRSTGKTAGDNDSSLPGVGKGTVDTDSGDVDITSTSTGSSSGSDSGNGSSLSQSSGNGLGDSGLTGSSSSSGDGGS